MNKLTENILKWTAALLMIAALGIAGNIDRNEAINGSISQELYHKIESDLGGTASESEIVKKYEEDKSKYDALGI